MRYALINADGSVENVIELSDSWPADGSWTAPEGYSAVATDSASIGDTYDKKRKVFIAPVAPVA